MGCKSNDNDSDDNGNVKCIGCFGRIIVQIAYTAPTKGCIKTIDFHTARHEGTKWIFTYFCCCFCYCGGNLVVKNLAKGWLAVEPKHFHLNNSVSGFFFFRCVKNFACTHTDVRRHTILLCIFICRTNSVVFRHCAHSSAAIRRHTFLISVKKKEKKKS